MDERFLYRGKRKDNGAWVTGYYVFTRKSSGVFGQMISEFNFDRHLIIELRGKLHEVIPETVGQCTGLKDKNGKLIFQGDILKVEQVKIKRIGKNGLLPFLTEVFALNEKFQESENTSMSRICYALMKLNYMV